MAARLLRTAFQSTDRVRATAALGIGLALMAGVRDLVTLAIGFTLIRWLGQDALSLVSSLAEPPYLTSLWVRAWLPLSRDSHRQVTIGGSE